MTPSTVLSMKGYGILKAALSPEDMLGVQKDLTVAPYTGATAMPTRAFKTYSESTKMMYVPKNFGIKHFGLPEEDRLPQGMDIDVAFAGSLRPEQLEPVNTFLKSARDPERMGGIIALDCGQGKCLGRDTPVLLFPDAAGHAPIVVKMVQDVRVGDVLVGDDSKPRVVKSVCTGRELMFRIVPVNPPVDVDACVVNASHILSLIDQRDNSVVDITIQELLKLPKDKKKHLKGFGVALVDHGLKNRIKWIENIVKARGDVTNYSVHIRCNGKNDMDHVWRSCMALGLLPKRDCVNGSVFFSKSNYDAMCIFEYVSHTHWMFDIVVEPLEIDQYFGFEIEGSNRRFLLGDLTVTHNTVCALYIIAALRKKTLVVVHKDFLLNQWRERLSTFLPSARIGIFKAKTQDVFDKDIIIGSLQSLSMKDYDVKAMFGDVGLLCIDECHRTGAEVFSRLYRRINTRYTLGLSATVSRKDGMTKVFKWHIGDIVYKASTANKDVVHVLLKDFKDGKDERDERDEGYDGGGYGKEVTMFNGKLNLARMINTLCDYPPRLAFVVSCICDILRKEDGGDTRKVLVLSDRRSQLDSMYRMLEGEGFACGFYYGGMRPAELKVSETKQILLATFAFCAEGLDVPKLDTLVLASPKSDIIQSVGRILREKPKNRSNTPIIVDIIDNYSIFGAQARKREKFYASKSYDLMRSC
jgi:superfamily II DNA or RNA helicase